MAEKDYMLYGTKILNLKTQEIGLLIFLWENRFADKTVTSQTSDANYREIFCLKSQINMSLMYYAA